MGKRSTITGYWRQRGATNSSSSRLGGPTPAVLLACTPAITFDPTLANTTLVADRFLPEGAIPSHAVITNAGGTGGIAPTVDVGLVGTVDALIAEGDADTASAALLTSGTALGTPLAADTQITAGVGASAATGGTVTVRVFFYMNDDASLGN